MEGDNLLDHPPIVGVCSTMCPIKEINFREKEKLVHRLEEGPSKNVERFVKKYQRSAAGIVHEPSTIRPPEVLEKTVHYLLNDVLSRNDVNLGVLYNFIQDRLRAVRQDLIVQQAAALECIPLLEPMVRFYVYFYYKMENEVTCDFDPVLNHKHLLECLKWLLCLYDSCDHRSLQRVEMEATYVLLNLGDPTALSRSLSLAKDLRNEVLLFSEELSLAWYNGNYYKVCKMLIGLPPLLSALTAAAHLSNVRRYALQVMSSAYNSKNLTYPLRNLKTILLYEDEKEVAKECCHYNLSCDENTVHFLKAMFTFKEDNTSNISLSILNELLDSTSLPDLVLCSGTI